MFDTDFDWKYEKEEDNIYYLLILLEAYSNSPVNRTGSSRGFKKRRKEKEWQKEGETEKERRKNWEEEKECKLIMRCRLSFE